MSANSGETSDEFGAHRLGNNGENESLLADFSPVEQDALRELRGRTLSREPLSKEQAKRINFLRWLRTVNPNHEFQV